MKNRSTLWVAAALLTITSCCANAASPTLNLLKPPGGQRGQEIEVELHGDRLKDATDLIFHSEGITFRDLKRDEKGKKITVTLVVADWCELGEQALRVRTRTGISDARTFTVGPYPTLMEATPNDSPAEAQRLTPNTTVTGVLKRRDSDWFAVDLKKGEPFSIELEGMRLGGVELDPMVTIFRSNGTRFLVADDSTLHVQDPVVSFIAPETDTYHIELRDSTYKGHDDAAYRMHVGTFTRPVVAYPPGGQAGERLEVSLLGDIRGASTSRVKLPENTSGTMPLLPERDGLIAPSPIQLRVSEFANVLEKEPNNSPDTAYDHTGNLPIAFNGVIDKERDRDMFKIALKKDQTVEIRVLAETIRSPLDPVLRVTDDKGKKTAENDDAGSLDSYVRFRAPEDGRYNVTVRDRLGRGGELFVYRMEVTTGRAEVALSLVPVDRRSQERQAIAVPRGGRFGVTMLARREGFGKQALSLSAGDLPAGVRVVNTGVEAVGDRATVIFEADGDAPLSHSLTTFTAARADGKPVTSRFNHNVRLIGEQNDDAFYTTDVDRLAVAVVEETPITLEVEPPRVPIVQGGVMALEFRVIRKDGAKGPVNVSVIDKPKGIGATSSVKLQPDQTEGVLSLNANKDAPIRACRLALQASVGTDDGVVWVASELFELEIIEPFVEMRMTRASVPRGGTVSMKCEIKPKVPFEGEATVSLQRLPRGVTAEPRTITAEDTEVVFEVKTGDESPVRKHRGIFCQLTLQKNGKSIIQNGTQNGELRIDERKQEIAANE